MLRVSQVGAAYSQSSCRARIERARRPLLSRNCRDDPQHFAVVFSEVRLPELTGPKFAREILPQVTVVTDSAILLLSTCGKLHAWRCCQRRASEATAD